MEDISGILIDYDESSERVSAGEERGGKVGAQNEPLFVIDETKGALNLSDVRGLARKVR